MQLKKVLTDITGSHKLSKMVVEITQWGSDPPQQKLVNILL